MMDDLAKNIVDTAENFVSSVAEDASGSLDYSEESLEVVEKMLAEAAPFFHEMSEEQKTSVIQSFGCYILEVGRRQFGGQYFWHEQYDQPILVVGEPTFHLGLLAWGKVEGRLSGDTADNIPFHYTGFAERARKAEPGSRAIYV
jgi:hypothetical protein